MNSKKIGNLNVYHLPSKKFKTVTLELKLRAPIDRKTITKRVLLASVLKKGTANYPSDVEMQEFLDELYGASLRFGHYKVNTFHVLNIELEFANEKFIPNESEIVEKALQFLHEVVFHPNVINDRFDSEIVDREKQTLHNHLKSVKDEKAHYASQRLMDVMCPDAPESIHASGYESDLDNITAESLYSYYCEMLKTSQFELFIVGDYNQGKMEKDLSETFPESNSNKIQDNIYSKQYYSEIDEPKTIKESDTSEQAHLLLGYQTNTSFTDADFAKMTVASTLLGGFPGSKLFMQLREKHSLAYTVFARWDMFSGILVIYGGIDPKETERAKQLIKEQITTIQQGNITDEELHSTKTILKSSITSSGDSASGMIDNEYKQVITNKQRDNNQWLEEISRVSKMDVIESAKKWQLDTIYILTKGGNEHEEKSI